MRVRFTYDQQLDKVAFKNITGYWTKGNKIESVKWVRRHYDGIGLNDAKDLVETVWARLEELGAE